MKKLLLIISTIFLMVLTSCNKENENISLDKEIKSTYQKKINEEKSILEKYLDPNYIEEIEIEYNNLKGFYIQKEKYDEFLNPIDFSNTLEENIENFKNYNVFFTRYYLDVGCCNVFYNKGLHGYFFDLSETELNNVYLAENNIDLDLDEIKIFTHKKDTIMGFKNFDNTIRLFKKLPEDD